MYIKSDNSFEIFDYALERFVWFRQHFYTETGRYEFLGFFCCPNKRPNTVVGSLKIKKNTCFQVGTNTASTPNFFWTRMQCMILPFDFVSLNLPSGPHVSLYHKEINNWPYRIQNQRTEWSPLIFIMCTSCSGKILS